jgi:hypothetical protein
MSGMFCEEPTEMYCPNQVHALLLLLLLLLLLTCSTAALAA